MASKLRATETFQGLFYEREGNPKGQSVLMIHGLGGTTNAYQMLVSDLEDFDVIRFDWAGHGRSATPKTTSIDSYVADCEGQLLRLALP